MDQNISRRNWLGKSLLTGGGLLGSLALINEVEAQTVNAIRVVDTFASLSATSGNIGDIVRIKGHTVAGIGGGDFIARSGSVTNDKGTKINYSTNSYWERINYSKLTFSMFGALESQLDSTQYCQFAIDAAIAANSELDISGNYKVTSVSLNNANGLQLSGRGSIIGISTTNTEALITLRNTVNVSIVGAWFINCNYLLSYDCAVWAYTDSPGQSTSYLNLSNICPVNAKQAWKFGNDNRPGDLVCEINIFGGNSYGCPSVILAIGSQTVVNFCGSTIASLTGSGDTAWQGLPQKTVVSRGATINITGGELLHVLLSTGGTSTTYNTLCEIQPIAYGSATQYGNINVNGAIVETGARLASTANPNNLSSPLNGYISFTGCHGVHTQDSSAFIETDPNFTGKLQLSSNNFFSTVLRSYPNIYCGGPCNIYCDDSSFGANFKSDLGGIVGGILHFSNRLVLSVSNLNGQSLANSSFTTLNFNVVANDGDLKRFQSAYDQGVFTVPSGGLKNIIIEAQILKSGLAGEWYIQINGVSYGVRTLGKYNQNSYSIQKLNAGDKIRVVVLNTGGPLTADATFTDWLKIFASN